MDTANKISALTFDTQEDGWEKSDGFIMRQVSEPVLDEKNPEDAVSVIIKMHYAGMCGSDRGIWNRVSFKDLIHNSLDKQNKTTRILGHEFTGEVVQAGSMIQNLYGIKNGDVVSGDSHITCGNCYQCKIGENNVCLNEKILGISTDGIFAPYVKIPAKNLFVINKDKVRSEIAAMYDPMGNAIHATTKADVKGKTVAVFGCGPIGLFSILFLKHFGASLIITVDTNQKNLDMAHQLGAHQTLCIQKGGDQQIISEIKKLTGGIGVDVALEMAGPNSSVINAIECARRGGKIMLFGLKDGDFNIPKFSQIITKGLSLYGIIGRRIFADWQTLDSIISDKSNGIQKKIWEVILQKGNGTVIDFANYNKENVKKAMDEHPKIIFKF